MKRKKVFLTIILVLLQFCCGSLWAEPTTAYQAEKVVAGWLKADAQPLGMALGQQISRVETFTDDYGEPIYYVVYLQPSGFVIVPADDQVEPIIGFVQEGVYEPSLDNPLGALVINDIQERISAVRNTGLATHGVLTTRAVEAKAKWDRLIEYSESYGILGLTTINDMRIAPLVQTRWGQRRCCEGTPDYLACYNYYTPESAHCNPMSIDWADGDPTNYPCGCVATAMAQLMRYHEHPSSGVGQHDFLIFASDLSCEPNTIATTRGGNGVGGPYDWANMVYQPGCSSSVAERQAIGALCYDAGISVNMHYRFPSSGASTANTLDAADSFVNLFNYSHAVRGDNGGSDIGAPLLNMVNPNLDAKHPVILGIYGSSGGHAVVCDGYGYNNSTLYHHLNMGWEGDDDAWYNLPTVDSSPSFNIVRRCVYNVHPSSVGDGEVVSGRVFGPNDVLIPNPSVYAEPNDVPAWIGGVSDSNGIYAITDLDSDTWYRIDAQVTGYVFPGEMVQTGTSIDDTTQCGNVWDIELHGDVLEIDSITPPEGPVGSWIRIQGVNFGAEPGSVNFENGNKWVNVPANQWSDSVVCCEVPESAGSGLVRVYTAQFDLSTGKNFNVTDPNIIHVDGSGFIPCIMNGSVEYPFDSIQKGINVSNNGDTVTVVPFTYYETIDFNNRVITLIGNDLCSDGIIAETIIDGNNNGPVVTFDAITDPNCTLSGFTITNGFASYGAGILCNNGSPTIKHCIIIGNDCNTAGGGMYNNSGSPTIANCMFNENLSNNGGGIYNNADSSPKVINCTFSGNSASSYGGGMYNDNGSNPVVTNCTFSENSADSNGGGIHNSDSNPTLTNCILWANTAPDAPQISNMGTSSPIVTYSDVQGGWSGTGNINANPSFISDTLLLSQNSPCIDAGDNNSIPPDVADLDDDSNTTEDTPYDLDNVIRIADGDSNCTFIVDMGAYEFSWRYFGDFDGQLDVDYDDLDIFAAAWLTRPCDPCWNQKCDIAYPRNQRIDWSDYAILAENWLIKGILCIQFNSSFEEGTVDQLYDDPYTGLETLTWVPAGWTFYEEDACDTCGANYSYCNSADEDDPNGNSYAKPDAAHYKTGSYSARFYARGDRCCSRYTGGNEWMENAILISSETMELPEYVSFWVFSENNLVDGGQRFGHQLVLYMCDANGCTKSVQCLIWRDTSGSPNAYMHSCTGGQLVQGEGPDANEIGADGENWYRYTQQWPVERTNPPFYFKIEAQGHRWDSGSLDSLTHFWVDDADFTDEYGNVLMLPAGDGIADEWGLAVLCDNWLVGVE